MLRRVLIGGGEGIIECGCRRRDVDDDKKCADERIDD